MFVGADGRAGIFLPVISMKNVIKFIWILFVGPDGIAGICFPVTSIKKLSNLLGLWKSYKIYLLLFVGADGIAGIFSHVI